MYEQYFQHFNKIVPLTPEEEEIIKPYLRVKKLRKKQYFLQDGDVCKAAAFVTSGMLRQYYVDEGGHEKIIQFAAEGWSVADL
ncbi:MAG TPA: Crp/Fnr family transcriptional regulator, partial [Patescibacteria group bacterium]|nr:Crp/Fnr family transcriptional regulator [Patescibacteria group bacterium]